MNPPTIGRHLLYTPYPGEMPTSNDVCTATVCHVQTDGKLNLAVLDANGKPHAKTSIRFIDPDGDLPGIGPYCQWMPYQVEAEEAQAEVEEARAGLPSTDEQLGL